MVQSPACSAASPTAIAGIRLEPRATSITVRAGQVTRTPSTVVVAAGRVSVTRRMPPLEREPGDRDLAMTLLAGSIEELRRDQQAACERLEVARTLRQAEARTAPLGSSSTQPPRNANITLHPKQGDVGESGWLSAAYSDGGRRYRWVSSAEGSEVVSVSDSGAVSTRGICSVG